MNNEEFFEQFQLILGKYNLIKKDSLFDTKGYVFTYDNFLKMQLIIQRINRKIPVIMMGETGCGKTFLITILAELIGATLHIFNIHAGIEDKHIIKFIETTIENEKIKFAKKIRILKEVNAKSQERQMTFKQRNINSRLENKQENFDNDQIWIFLD